MAARKDYVTLPMPYAFDEDTALEPLGRATRITTEEDFLQACKESELRPVVLFKHSVTCPISSWARSEMRPLWNDFSVYELFVQDSRLLSGIIAATLNVRHESPQVIVLYKARPTFHASHSGILEDVVRDAVRRASHAGA